MDDEARQRLQRPNFPRPPDDVIDEAHLAGFLTPHEQTWIRGDGLHVGRPAQFRCGFHNETWNDPPVEVADLPGRDGKIYRAGQCLRCGRIFWGVLGERPPSLGR
jgi:hypothetical protein